MRLIRSRSARFAELLKRSGRVDSPTIIATKSVKYTVVSAMAFWPAAAVLGIFLSPWFLFAALVPLGFALAPELRLRDMVVQRREGVERELPFFAALVSVLGGAGVPLYSVLRDVASSDVFEWIRKDAMLVRRDVEILGMNANDSLERVASNHPSKRFSEFLVGYTSKARSGGDVPFYLVGESGSLLRDLEEGWGRYVARVGIIGSMMITVFGVLPLLLMVVGVFSPGFSTVGLVLFTGLGVPLFTIGLLHMAGRMQPMRAEAPRGKAGVAMGLALPGGLVGFVSGLAWAGVAAALFIFLLAYGTSVKEQLEETKALDEGLFQFLRDLLEYKRQDYDLGRALVAIEANGHYNTRFARVLSKAAAQLKAGIPLDEVKIECGTRLGKLTFLLLGQMSRSGGGSVDTVYQVSSFAGRLIDMRRSSQVEMKPYLILSYVSPILLAFGITFVQGVLSSFGSRVMPGFATLHTKGFQFGSVPPGLTQISDLLIIVSAASLGLIGAKITDLTVRNTLRASVNVLLAAAAVAIMATLGSHSLTQLLST